MPATTRRLMLAVALTLAALASTASAEPAPPSFTYQGLVRDGGSPANGAYDLRARLYDAVTGGTQIGTQFTASGVTITNGLLNKPMNFGANGNYNSRRLWIELDFRIAGGGAYTTLAPRQELTATPYALGLVAPVSINSAERFPFSVYSTNTDGNGYGILSQATVGLQAVSNVTPALATSGIGVIGSAGDNGIWGVYGIVTTASGLARGVYGNASAGGTGVFGEAPFGTNSQGVAGFSQQGLGVVGVGRTAVTGDATGGGSDYGGRFTSTGINSNGVKGECSNGTSAYGVWGVSSTGYAGYFTGKVNVAGTLTKSGGSFRIDHPLDPANKYLSHSFVESPDMMNIYNGTIATNERGYATVVLPEWFTALNRDYRYQLTVIDEADTADFVQAKVVRGVPASNPVGKPTSFTIRTSRPSTTVSWQITGIRQDAWANRNRIQVEEFKTGYEAGRFVHPELFNQPQSKSMDAAKYAVEATP